MPAATPTAERLTAVLAQIHKAVATVAEDDDRDLDPALAACVQLGLSGPHLVPPQEPAARPPRAACEFLRARILPPSRVPAPGQQLDLNLDLVGAGAANDGDAASPPPNPVSEAATLAVDLDFRADGTIAGTSTTTSASYGRCRSR